MVIGASRASRMVDRLVVKNLVDLDLDPDTGATWCSSWPMRVGRPSTRSSPTAGRALQPVLAPMPVKDRDRLGVLLDRFTEAAREVAPWRNSASL